MGRKKKKPAKPWCWYCNRSFDDEKILIQHQKSRHFKKMPCHICHKKLYTGPGLAIHCMQVHKDNIDKIPNALPNRSSVDIEVYGMEGIPEEDIREHERTKSDPKAASMEPVSALSANFPAPTMASGVPPPMMPPGIIPPMLPSGHASYMMPGMMPRLPYSGVVPALPPGIQFPPGMLHPQQIPGVARPPPPPLPSGLPAMLGQPPPPLPTPPQAASGLAASSGVGSTSQAISNNPLFPAVANAATVASASFGSGDDVTDDQTSVGRIISAPHTRIVHPEQDISLEEHRARLPKYKTTLTDCARSLNGSTFSSNGNNSTSSIVTSNNSNNSKNPIKDSISQPLYSTPTVASSSSKAGSFQSTFRPAY